MRKQREPSADWHSTTDFVRVLRAVKPVGTKRRYRLFMCACCRHFLWPQMKAESSRLAVEVAEAYADNLVDQNAVRRAKRAADQSREEVRLQITAAAVLHGLPARSAEELPFFCLQPWIESNYNQPTRQQQVILCDLVRDIFGNPFRPVAFDPDWRTDTAVSLARGMYESRDFSPMPILADALQDAGCEHADVLDHCRGPGPHVRGCWVVDLVLGKH